LSSCGSYVAVFLAEQDWTQPNIGFVLTAAGFAGLLAQLPGGGLLDAMRSKQTAVALGATMGAAAALIIAMWPSLPLVLAALVLQAITGGFLGLAVVAISLGLVGHDAGRAPRTQSAFRIDRRGSRDRPRGPDRPFPLVSRDLPAAALVLPLLFALGRIQPSDIHFGRAVPHPRPNACDS
jgi:hypothetical protein